MTTPTVNRGFIFESGDPSVGLFGTEWSHDGCSVVDCDPEPSDFEVDEEQLAVVRLDSMSTRTWYLLTCRDCGMQVLVNRDDFNPTDEYAAETWAEVDAYVATEVLTCLDERLGDCTGEVEWRMPLSATGKPFARCDKHWADRLDAQEEINRRYPDSPFPPSDFDPTYAGERWEDDY